MIRGGRRAPAAVAAPRRRARTVRSGAIPHRRGAPVIETPVLAALQPSLVAGAAGPAAPARGWGRGRGVAGGGGKRGARARAAGRAGGGGGGAGGGGALQGGGGRGMRREGEQKTGGLTGAGRRVHPTPPY